MDIELKFVGFVRFAATGDDDEESGGVETVEQVNIFSKQYAIEF